MNVQSDMKHPLQWRRRKSLYKYKYLFNILPELLLFFLKGTQQIMSSNSKLLTFSQVFQEF